MEIGELKAFVTVAAEHSFSPAAIELCRTQDRAVLRIGGDEPCAHVLRAQLYELGAGTSGIRRMIIGRDLVQGR
jgi:hypothetical protein